MSDFRFARARTKANAIRLGLARGQYARPAGRLRFPCGPAQRGFRLDCRRRQQLWRLLGSTVDRAAPGQVARAARTRVIQGLGMADAQTAAKKGAGPRKLSAAAGKSGSKQRVARMQRI